MTPLEALKGKTIALVCASHRRSGVVLSEPFLLGLVGQIGDALAEAGCELLISSFPPGLHDWKAQFIDSGRAAGIIVLGERHQPESVALLEQSDAPFIVWGGTSRASTHYVVGSDNTRGGYLATRHLLEQGRRRIVFLGYRHTNNAEIMERFAGYEQALNEFNIDIDEMLILKPHIDQRNQTFAAINHQLISRHVSFDAIFATNDMLAIEAIGVLTNFGLDVPEDISIVGFDNQVVSRLSRPELTTIEQDINFGARELVNRLANIISGGKTKSLRLGVKLIVRDSCTPNKETKGTLILRENGMIADIDRKAETILGYKKEELVSSDIRDILVDETTAEEGKYRQLDMARYRITKNQGLLETLYIHHKNGKALTVDLTVNKDHNSDSEQYIFTISHLNAAKSAELSTENFKELFDKAVADRTEALSETAKRMTQFAFEDGLTGLYNRRYFDTSLEKALAQAYLTHQPLSLLLFDVDFFKKYNDNYGHIAGDACLKFIASMLKKGFPRNSDIIARYGGEEFSAILPNTSSDEAVTLAEKTLKAIHSEKYTHTFSEIDNVITLSCGLHTILNQKDNNVEENVNTLLLKADQALYRAKENGRNQVRR